MAKIDDLTTLISKLVVNEKSKVTSFLRSQGINVSSSAKAEDVSVLLFQALGNAKFNTAFVKWINSTFMVGNSSKSGEFANLDDYNPLDLNNLIKTNPKLKEDGSKIGNALRSFDWIGGINAGLQFWQTSESAKAKRRELELIAKTQREQIEAQVQSGELSKELAEIQLEALRIQSSAPQSKTVLYIVGGAVAVGLLATIGYVLVKRKRR